jgi:hypothetical protein
MPALPRRAVSHLARTLPWTLLTAAILFARVAWPPRDLDAVGPVALRDLALTLLLWAVTSTLAFGLGRRLLRLVDPPTLTALERIVLSLALGLGALGFWIFGLGMVGLLDTGWIAATLLGLSLWVGPGVPFWSAGPRQAVRAARDAWRSAEPLARVSAVLASVIGVLAFLHSVSPPWDYDGLMYHLVGPRTFLSAARLFPVPESFFLNGPFTGEMLFTIGMGFGDDVFPKLIHLTWGLLLVASAYAAGRRWVGTRGGWLSAVALLSVPALPVWAAFAYVDITWSVFEFLALMAAVSWWSTRSVRWLVLSGLMTGLAMGTKYLGLMGFAVLGLFVLVASLTRDGWKSALRASLAIGVPAVLVASPWYLKNMVWLGNPVFPLYFGARGWNETHLEMYSTFLASFGVGRSPLDYLLLPWNIYARHAEFGATMNRIDVPGLIFPVVLLYPLLKKDRAVTMLLGVAATRSAVWAAGSQQIRFLLPVYPALAVAAAYVADRWRPAARSRIPWALLLPSLATAFLLITAFYQGVVVFAQIRPLPVILGAESRREFLERSVGDFRAASFVQEDLPAGSRVLMIGDARSYYCPTACLPPDHFAWADAITHLAAGQGVGDWLRLSGATHLLISLEDLDFLLQHDTQGIVEAAFRRLLEWRDRGCLTEVYSDRWTRVYQIACD